MLKCNTIWQAFSQHVRNEVARNYVLSEVCSFFIAILNWLCCLVLIALQQILAQSVLGISNPDHYNEEPNWQRCRFSIRQKQEFCFDIDSSLGVDNIPELNCVPDPSKLMSIVEIDNAAEEAMDRYAKESVVFPKEQMKCPLRLSLVSPGAVTSIVLL